MFACYSGLITVSNAAFSYGTMAWMSVLSAMLSESEQCITCTLHITRDQRIHRSASPPIGFGEILRMGVSNC